MPRVLLITGKPGVGKTTVCERLGPLLGWPVLSIDAERAAGGTWDTLAARVAELREPAVIESIAKPRPYRMALRRHRVSELVVACDEADRLERVADRDLAGDRSYGRPYRRSRVLHTSGDVSDAELEDVARWAAM